MIRGIEVVSLGFTGVYQTRSNVERDIEAHKKPGNLVIVSFHWGVENTHDVIDVQREFGRLAIDAGANLVLGHHPHVIQAMETYRGRHIVHSLGNFVFGANTNPPQIESMIYRETFVESDGHFEPKSFDIIPVHICSRLPCSEFRPVQLSGKPRSDFVAWFERENAKLEKRHFKHSIPPTH